MLSRRLEWCDRIWNASGAPLGIGAAVAEQPLEDDLRIVLHRQGRGRTLPRDRVAIRAAQAVAAAERRVLDHHLERWERRVLADVLRRELIHRDAEMRPW